MTDLWRQSMRDMDQQLESLKRKAENSAESAASNSGSLGRQLFYPEPASGEETINDVLADYEARLKKISAEDNSNLNFTQDTQREGLQQTLESQLIP